MLVYQDNPNVFSRLSEVLKGRLDCRRFGLVVDD